MIAEQELANFTIIDQLSANLRRGCVTGQVGSINLDDLDAVCLRDVSQNLQKYQARTVEATELSKITMHMAKIRSSLDERKKFGQADWKSVKTELDNCGDIYKKYDVARDEMNLIKEECVDLRIRSTLTNALQKGWDKSSDHGELHPTRIDQEVLR